MYAYDAEKEAEEKGCPLSFIRIVSSAIVVCVCIQVVIGHVHNDRLLRNAHSLKLFTAKTAGHASVRQLFTAVAAIHLQNPPLSLSLDCEQCSRI